MRATVWAVALAGALFVASAGVAEACSRSVSSKAAKTVVPSQQIDQALLQRSILSEVNFHRCRARLSSVGEAARGLTAEARKHSVWMARNQNLSHQNNVSGSRTLKQRIKNSGVRFRTGSENIGMVHRYQIDNRRFKILDSASCQFLSQDNKRLPAHSYASLARHIVTLWMNSPGHRKNILDPKVKAMSSAAAFDPKADYCGRFWLTQNFIG